MLLLTRVVLFCLLLLPSTGPATAFDGGDIKRWAATMAPLEQWGAANRGKLRGWMAQDLDALAGATPPNRKQIEAFRSPFKVAVKGIEDAGLDAEPSRIIAVQGFDDLEDWAKLSDRIMRAYTAVQMKGGSSTPKEIKARIKDVEKSEHLNDDQKAAMKARLTAILIVAEIMEDTPSRDVETVKQNMEVIAAAFGN